MFSRLFGRKSQPSKRENKFTLANLKDTFVQLEKHSVVTAANKDQIVEFIRSISELIIWGDQHNAGFFEYFAEKRVLSHFIKLLTSPKCPQIVQNQIIQAISMLLQNTNSEMSIFYLLSNNYINDLIVYPFDFSNEDILASYISFLKALSLRIDSMTIQFFFNAAANDFPLYTEALQFFNHSDNMVRIFVRTLTLNVYRCDDPLMRRFVLDKSAVPYFSNLAWFLRDQVGALTRLCRSKSNNTNNSNGVASTTPSPVVELSHIDEFVEQQYDVLYYLHDILTLGINEMNHTLTDQLLSHLVLPVLIGSLYNEDSYSRSGSVSGRGGRGVGVGVGVGEENSADETTPSSPVLRIPPRMALFFLSHLLRVFTFSPLLNSIATCLINPSLPAVAYLLSVAPPPHPVKSSVALTSLIYRQDESESEEVEHTVRSVVRGYIRDEGGVDGDVSDHDDQSHPVMLSSMVLSNQDSLSQSDTDRQPSTPDSPFNPTLSPLPVPTVDPMSAGMVRLHDRNLQARSQLQQPQQVFDPLTVFTPKRLFMYNSPHSNTHTHTDTDTDADTHDEVEVEVEVDLGEINNLESLSDSKSNTHDQTPVISEGVGVGVDVHQDSDEEEGKVYYPEPSPKHNTQHADANTNLSPSPSSVSSSVPISVPALSVQASEVVDLDSFTSHTQPNTPTHTDTDSPSPLDTAHSLPVLTSLASPVLGTVDATHTRTVAKNRDLRVDVTSPPAYTQQQSHAGVGVGVVKADPVFPVQPLRIPLPANPLSHIATNPYRDALLNLLRSSSESDLISAFVLLICLTENAAVDKALLVRGRVASWGVLRNYDLLHSVIGGGDRSHTFTNNQDSININKSKSSSSSSPSLKPVKAKTPVLQSMAHVSLHQTPMCPTDEDEDDTRPETETDQVEGHIDPLNLATVSVDDVSVCVDEGGLVTSQSRPQLSSSSSSSSISPPTNSTVICNLQLPRPLSIVASTVHHYSTTLITSLLQVPLTHSTLKVGTLHLLCGLVMDLCLNRATTAPCVSASHLLTVLKGLKTVAKRLRRLMCVGDGDSITTAIDTTTISTTTGTTTTPTITNRVSPHVLMCQQLIDVFSACAPRHRALLTQSNYYNLYTSHTNNNAEADSSRPLATSTPSASATPLSIATALYTATFGTVSYTTKLERLILSAAHLLTDTYSPAVNTNSSGSSSSSVSAGVSGSMYVCPPASLRSLPSDVRPSVTLAEDVMAEVDRYVLLYQLYTVLASPATVLARVYGHHVDSVEATQTHCVRTVVESESVYASMEDDVAKVDMVCGDDVDATLHTPSAVIQRGVINPTVVSSRHSHAHTHGHGATHSSDTLSDTATVEIPTLPLLPVLDSPPMLRPGSLVSLPTSPVIPCFLLRGTTPIGSADPYLDVCNRNGLGVVGFSGANSSQRQLVKQGSSKQLNTNTPISAPPIVSVVPDSENDPVRVTTLIPQFASVNLSSSSLYISSSSCGRYVYLIKPSSVESATSPSPTASPFVDRDVLTSASTTVYSTVDMAQPTHCVYAVPYDWTSTRTTVQTANPMLTPTKAVHHNNEGVRAKTDTDVCVVIRSPWKPHPECISITQVPGVYSGLPMEVLNDTYVRQSEEVSLSDVNVNANGNNYTSLQTQRPLTPSRHGDMSALPEVDAIRVTRSISAAKYVGTPAMSPAPAFCSSSTPLAPLWCLYIRCNSTADANKLIDHINTLYYKSRLDVLKHIVCASEVHTDTDTMAVVMEPILSSPTLAHTHRRRVTSPGTARQRSRSRSCSRSRGFNTLAIPILEETHTDIHEEPDMVDDKDKEIESHVTSGIEVVDINVETAQDIDTHTHIHHNGDNNVVDDVTCLHTEANITTTPHNNDAKDTATETPINAEASMSVAPMDLEDECKEPVSMTEAGDSNELEGVPTSDGVVASHDTQDSTDAAEASTIATPTVGAETDEKDTVLEGKVDLVDKQEDESETLPASSDNNKNNNKKKNKKNNKRR